MEDTQSRLTEVNQDPERGKSGSIVIALIALAAAFYFLGPACGIFFLISTIAYQLIRKRK